MCVENAAEMWLSFKCGSADDGNLDDAKGFSRTRYNALTDSLNTPREGMVHVVPKVGRVCEDLTSSSCSS